MKKIIFISNEASYTGAPIFLVKLVRHLNNKLDYKPIVFFSKPGLLSASLANDGIEVINSDKSNINYSLQKKVWRRFGHYIYYLKLLLVERPCLVYSNTIVNFGEVIIAGFLRVPVILHMHEGEHFSNQYRYRLKLACFFSARIIVGSLYVNKVLFSITNKIGKVIYIGVQTPNNILIEKRDFKNPVLLGMIGTITPNKGQLVALEALLILVKKGIEVQLIIAGEIGDVDYHNKITYFVRENSLDGFVKFIGTVPDAEEFIGVLDLLIVPSFDEALPTVILEAFSIGIPVVASRVGGVPEIIEDRLSGFLFEAGDAEMLANCLLKIFNGDYLMDNISSEAISVLHKKFNLFKNNNEIENVINEVLSR